jgi:hypothetical protein
MTTSERRGARSEVASSEDEEQQDNRQRQAEQPADEGVLDLPAAAEVERLFFGLSLGRFHDEGSGLFQGVQDFATRRRWDESGVMHVVCRSITATFTWKNAGPEGPLGVTRSAPHRNQ